MSKDPIQEWQNLDFDWAAIQIDKIEATDPHAESKALDILLANAHPALVDAFNAMDRRCHEVRRASDTLALG